MIHRCVRATLVAWCAVALLCSGAALNPLQAQEKKKEAKGQPFLVVSVASFERLMEDADFIFASAGRPELSEMIGGALSNVRDLKGLNRDSTAGLLLFLDGLTPVPIGFVPVKDIDEMMKTITVGPVTTNKIEDGLYEIRGGRQSLFAKISGDYAFVSQKQENLERDLSDPTQYTRRLSASYDVAVSVNLRAIPKPSRELLLDFLRASTEASLQQRDGEPDSAFRIRKAAATVNQENTEMFLTQAEEATLGFNVSSAEKAAFLELVVTADPKSEYAKVLNELGTSRSRFTPLLKNSTPLTASAALMVDKNGRKFIKELLTVAEQNLIGELDKSASKDETKVSPISELFKSVQASVADGKLDFVAQFVGDPPGPFTFAGGLTIAESEKFNIGLTEIFERLKGKSEFESVQTNVLEHRGVILHRLQGKRVPDNNADRLFGKDHGLYIGSGNGILWFAIGGENGLPVLKSMIDTVTDAPADDNPVMPAQIVVHLSSWLGLMERPDGTANPVVELMRESFAQGGGTIRAEIKPIQDGMQLRLNADEGFIRLVGKAIGKRIDQR
ncbi:MAG: hypothetical protein JWN70_3657 [Planctomycetaceae bacterium]|nr:hypothetical protein [Planctomycetaceae bacterium]